MVTKLWWLSTPELVGKEDMEQLSMIDTWTLLPSSTARVMRQVLTQQRKGYRRPLLIRSVKEGRKSIALPGVIKPLTRLALGPTRGFARLEQFHHK
jgi:hypothetical protein